MKFTAMIIDDEEIVREGLSQLINWQEEEYELLESGIDGQDGLQKLLKYCPDLVLVDIKMPGLGGLEVIRRAKEQGFAGNFLILTGYSEFEYARTAISMGVEGYLLKPIDEDELLEYVRKVHDRLEQDMHLVSYHQKNEEKVRSELLRRILMNAEPIDMLEKDVNAYHLDLDADQFCVAVCREDDLLAGEDSVRFYEKVESFTKTDFSCFAEIIMDNQVILIGKNIDYGTWKQRLQKYQERVARQFEKGFQIAIGSIVKSWKELAVSYENARFLLDQAFFLGNDHILTLDDICNIQKQGEMVSIEYLEMLVEVGDIAGIRRAIDMTGDYCSWHLLKEVEIKITITRDLMKLRSSLEKKYGSDVFAEDRLQLLLRHIMRAEELRAVLDAYGQVLTDLSRQIGADGSGNTIRRVYHYMEMNYDKDLKLESIARVFNYNSAYLGKLFRKETGDSFNNALDMIRIANARRLLEETAYKVYQISEMVGYSSIDYFYTKFRKCVGVSPKEYRKNLQNHREQSNE